VSVAQQPIVVAPVKFKDVGMAYLLWFFLGAIGVHKFYLGRKGLGIAYSLTVGFVGFGLLYDLFTLPSQVRRANEEIARQANITFG
jgi:TM2 domain-containing membrane protein YozV